MMRVIVVDYGAGNLKSVENALRHLNAEFLVTAAPEAVARADKVIFPGVGEAGAAMANLRRTGLDAAIGEFFKTGRPLFGICIGCQVIMDRSEESDTVCLGLVRGAARRLPDTPGFKIPQIGWNQARPTRPHPLFQGIPESASFYFVHSYYPDPADPADRLAATEYMIPFTSAVTRDNLCAVQFHPEKSGKHGLKMLSNFLELK